MGIIDIAFLPSQIVALKFEDIQLFSWFSIPLNFEKKYNIIFSKTKDDKIFKDTNDWYDLNQIMDLPKVNESEEYYLTPFFINYYITEKMPFTDTFYMQITKAGWGTALYVNFSQKPLKQGLWLPNEFKILYSKDKVTIM